MSFKGELECYKFTFSLPEETIWAEFDGIDLLILQSLRNDLGNDLGVLIAEVAESLGCSAERIKQCLDRAESRLRLDYSNYSELGALLGVAPRSERSSAAIISSMVFYPGRVSPARHWVRRVKSVK